MNPGAWLVFVTSGCNSFFNVSDSQMALYFGTKFPNSSLWHNQILHNFFGMVHILFALKQNYY